jgi:hypothetical protein
MSSFLIGLSDLILKVAQTPYLDGYCFGTLVIVATIAVNAVVIHCIYEFGGKAIK